MDILPVSRAPVIGAISQEREELESILDNWVRLRSEGENRSKAKEKILDCYDNKDIDLRLDYLGLLDLPRVFTKGFTHVTILEVAGNRFTTIPEAIGDLIGLEQLFLGGNRLIEVSDMIANFNRLLFVDFTGNRLTSLPDSFFNMGSTMRDCGLHQNYFSEQYVRIIQQRVSQRQNPFTIHISIYEEVDMLDYESCIVELCSLGEVCVRDHIHLSNFEDHQKNEFAEFYSKLPNSLVYKEKSQKRITANVLLNCLNLASIDKVFEGVFFEVLKEASRSCGDRIALGMNGIYLQYCLFTKFPDEMSPAYFVVGLKRLELLEKEARAFVKRIRGVVDEVEVYLALQVKLKDDLKLPSFSDRMLYFFCSALTNDIIREIKERVEAQTNPFELLNNSPLWKEYVERNFAEEIRQIRSESFPDLSEISYAQQQLFKANMQRFIQEKTEEELEKEDLRDREEASEIERLMAIYV